MMPVSTRVVAVIGDRFEFTVEGVGDFPLDMLRHDSAYPADKESVAAIMAGLAWAAARKQSRERLVVRLVSHRAPAAERWLTFGWTVTASRPYAVGDREV
jgi:hypothetical protein